MSTARKSQLEFIFLLASLMSLVALSIDALLPALGVVGDAIGSTSSTDNQLLITMFFLGLGFGQLIVGPISDSLGRKPIIYVGFVVFVLASILCIYSTNLKLMVMGRFLQGIGLSAPRTISIAMVRDRFSGDYMAKVMSFIVTIFILVPVVAPAMGKLLLDLYGWRSIFYLPVVMGFLVMIWFWKRQPETLSMEHKIPFRWRLFKDGLLEFIKFKESIIFTLISGLISGAFFVYLSGSQIIFEEQLGLREEFPYIFAGLAIAVGFSTFLNGTYVVKFGMLRMVTFFTAMFTLNSLIYIILFAGKPNPNLVVLLIFFALQFFSLGFIFGNLRSLAMQPLGHIAGVGSAINGFVSTVMAVPLAIFIGEYLKDTAAPLFVGFLCCGIMSILLMALLRNIRS